MTKLALLGVLVATLAGGCVAETPHYGYGYHRGWYGYGHRYWHRGYWNRGIYVDQAVYVNASGQYVDANGQLLPTGIAIAPTTYPVAGTATVAPTYPAYPVAGTATVAPTYAYPSAGVTVTPQPQPQTQLAAPGMSAPLTGAQ